MPRTKKRRTLKKIPQPLPREKRPIFPNAPEEFFIRHLPLDLSIIDFPENLPSLFVPWMEHLDLMSKLRSLQKDYQRTGNGIFLISAFLTTYRCGLYPPIWVLKGLAKSFEDYRVESPKQPLDAYLGLKPGRGQPPAPKAAAIRERNKLIAHDMFFLRHKFGLTIYEAAETVRGKLAKYHILRPSLDNASEPYREDTLAKWYPRWAKEFGLSEEYFYDIASQLTSDFLREFLEQFPTDDLSETIKSKLVPP